MRHQAVALGEAFATRARLGERYHKFVHRFHTITEELSVLVFFAPAEGSDGDTC